MAKNQPIHDIRLGRIRAAIWANEGKAGVRYNIAIERLYLEGSSWRSTGSFGRDDLLLVAKVADLAHTWIFEATRRDNGEQEREDEPDDDVE